MKNITYTECNGIRYPNLELPKQTNYPLGKYANLRLDFMKKHRKGRYTTLLGTIDIEYFYITHPVNAI